MSTNVRPGDRAIVVKARRPENLGIICEVIESAPVGDHHLSPGDAPWRVLPQDGTCWVVECLGRPAAIEVLFGGGVVGVERHRVTICPDSQLRRLPRPDEMDDATPVQDSRPVLEETA